MIHIRYKKSSWVEWCVWFCKDKNEADKVRSVLQLRGYEVQ